MKRKIVHNYDTGKYDFYIKKHWWCPWKYEKSCVEQVVKHCFLEYTILLKYVLVFRGIVIIEY